MNERLKLWLDGEMKEFSVLLKEFKRKMAGKVPIWMALSVGGMTALGFAVGYDFAYILRVHFLIGCGIALFIWLGFWMQNRVTSMKKVRTLYEKEINAFFRSEEDRDAFWRQMESGNYGKLSFMNTMTESYPGRLLIGPDYWMYFNGRNCCFYRAADILNIYGREETTRMSYRAGSARVRQNMSVGVSLVLVYKNGSPSEREKRRAELFFEKSSQYGQARELIQRYCPECREWS